MNCLLRCRDEKCGHEFEEMCLDSEALPPCPKCGGQVKFAGVKESAEVMGEMFDQIKDED